MAELKDRKDTLLQAGLTLASELSLPVVLQRIVDLAAEISDARFGALGVIGEGDTLVEFVTTGIDAEARQAIGALPTGRGVLGVLIHDPRPIRLKNIADHPRSVGFPAHHPPMRSFLGAPVQAMGRVYGNLYLADKRDAEEFSPEDEEALTVLATQAGVAIANAVLYEEVRSRERWLDAIRQITTNVLTGGDEGMLLGSIAERARELAGADAATIVVHSGSPGELVVAAAAGARADELRGEILPEDGSISGAVMRTGESRMFDDVSAEAHAYQPIVALGRHGPSIYVPLRVQGGSAGTLMVANLKGGARFSPATKALVESLADAASVAIEYDRAQSNLRRLGLMEERERIAKELHDGIIQSLFAVGMSLQGTALMTKDVEMASRIEHAVDELDGVIRDLRNYIFGLRPGILADRQLEQALRELAREVESRGGPAVDVQVDSALAARLTSRSADIVQLAREALSNVARHARASKATLSLERQGSQAVLTMSDDGAGFDAEHHDAGEAGGSGIRNMRERAATLGGSLRIASRAGEGTTLTATFPQ